MDSPCIKQTVCKVLKIFQYGKYLVAYVLNAGQKYVICNTFDLHKLLFVFIHVDICFVHFIVTAKDRFTVFEFVVSTVCLSLSHWYHG